MKKIGIVNAAQITATLLLSPDGVEGGVATDQPSDEKEPLTKVSSVTIGGNSLDIFEHKQTRGNDVGAVFYGPDFDNLTMEQLSIFPVDKLLENFIRPNFKRMCSAFSRAAKKYATAAKKEGDAETILSKFGEFLSELTAKADSIRALVIRRNDLLKELVKFKPAKGGEELQKFIECSTKIATISAQIQELQEADDDDKNDNATPTPEGQPQQQAA